MLPPSGDRGEQIFYRFVPRSGRTLEGIQITTFDEQAHLLTSFDTQEVPNDGILVVNKGSCLGAYGYVITHRDHGILAYMPPTPFIRTMHITSHAIGGGGVKVSVPIDESPSAARMEYMAADRSQFSTSSIVGKEPSTHNVNSRITIAANRREKVANAKHYGQRWFANGSRIEAMNFIQSKIRNARSRIMIADPYLAGLQLGQFLYAVNGDTVKVTLLTSALAFKSLDLKVTLIDDFKSRLKKHPETKQSKLEKLKNRLKQKIAPKQSKLTKLDDFKHRLDVLANDVNVKADVYVLPSSVLHDRFLIIDDAVWFLGNSLNTLGNKSSVIVKLPHSEEVIEQLEKMQNLPQTERFDSYREKKLGHL
jgi:hypothetical protein